MTDIDITNFSSSSPHRLPTLSASQALHNLTSAPRQVISTGLSDLDAVLQGREPASTSEGSRGGLARGQVTEVYGPPGVGKTAFAMQIAAKTLRLGDSVIWVDTSYTLSGSRLKDILSNSTPPQTPELPTTTSQKPFEQLLEGFHHFHTPTLPHLLALLIHPSPSFPPSKTSLIVIDAISILFALAFPKGPGPSDARKIPTAPKSDAVQWAASRRWAVMGDFINKIGKLAATRNIAVLLISQTMTRIRAETGAVLHPSLASTAWDAGISTRIVLYQDWVFRSPEGSNQVEHQSGIRFAGVVKANGISHEGVGIVTSFTIEKHSLQATAIKQDQPVPQPPVLPAPPLKRKSDEIANSQSEDGDIGSDEEFGWLGDEESLATEGLSAAA